MKRGKKNKNLKKKKKVVILHRSFKNPLSNQSPSFTYLPSETVSKIVTAVWRFTVDVKISN